MRKIFFISPPCFIWKLVVDFCMVWFCSAVLVYIVNFRHLDSFLIREDCHSKKRQESVGLGIVNMCCIHFGFEGTVPSASTGNPRDSLGDSAESPSFENGSS